MWDYGLDRGGTGQGQVVGTCECANELSGSIKCGEFLDWLRTGQLLKKDSVPWSKQVSKYSALLHVAAVYISHLQVGIGL